MSVQFFGLLLGWEALNCSLTGRCFAFFAIWCSQADADPVFINLKPHATLFIVINELARVRIGGGVGSQTLFELGVVGIDLGGAVVLVEIQFG